MSLTSNSLKNRQWEREIEADKMRKQLFENRDLKSE